MSLAGAIADARKSATRMYINNFADKGRQTTIDMLLVCQCILREVEQKLICNRVGLWIKRQYTFSIRLTTLSMPS